MDLATAVPARCRPNRDHPGDHTCQTGIRRGRVDRVGLPSAPAATYCLNPVYPPSISTLLSTSKLDRGGHSSAVRVRVDDDAAAVQPHISRGPQLAHRQEILTISE